MHLLRVPTGQDQQMARETIRDRGWPVPELTRELVGAVNSFYRLHTGRTRSFPGAFQVSWASIDIHVSDRNQARFYLATWDRLHECIAELARSKHRSTEKSRHASNHSAH